MRHFLEFEALKELVTREVQVSDQEVAEGYQRDAALRTADYAEVAPMIRYRMELEAVHSAWTEWLRNKRRCSDVVFLNGAPPTAAPQPTSPPAPLAPPPPVRLEVVADDEKFDKTELRARTGAAVTAVMRNNDTGVDHNLSFSIPGLDHGDTCPGPCTATQSFTAPAAGRYNFFCTIHAMVGDFIVEP